MASDGTSLTSLPHSSSYATAPVGDSSMYSAPGDSQGYLRDPYGAHMSGSASQLSPGGISDMEHMMATKGPLGLHDEEGDLDIDWVDDESEGDDSRFVNFSLLSHIAVRLRDKVPRGTHVKGSIPYPQAFTGKDIVVSPTHPL